MPRAVVALVLVTFSAFARTEAPVAPLAFGAVATWFPPAMASDGVHSFVVWNDSRDRATSAIYGARIDANGTLLDPLGVHLIDAIGQPAIAYGDGRYLVVEPSLRFAIVDREANVVARGMLTGLGGSVRAVFNGRDFLVFWGYDVINVATVDRDGRATEPLTLVPPQYDVRLHAAATNGSRIVVLYTRGVELRAAVTTTTGAPLSDAVIGPVAFAEVPASIAASPDGFVAVWQRLEGDVAAVRLDANGALVQGPVSVVPRAVSPKVAGSQLFTLEGDIQSFRFVRRALSSELVAGEPVTLFESPTLSVASYATSETLVVAHLHDPNRRVVEDGLYAIVSGGPRLVSRAGVAQLEPRVAAGEHGTLVAWREQTGLTAAFLPRAGAPEHFAVTSGYIESYAVAAQGDTHLVVWAGDDGIVARLRDEKNVTLDELRFSEVAAASDGHGFVVAWAGVGVIRVVRVTTAGEVMDGAAIPYGSVTGRPPLALACDAGQCVVAWRNQTATRTCPRLGCLVIDERVMAVRLDSALSPVDATPWVLSEDLSGIYDLTAAADDGEYAVGWANLGQTYVRTLASDDTLVVPGEHPALARQDGGWLLVREFRGELVATRLRDAGAPYELALFRDAQTRTEPSLARDGAVTVAVYARTTRGEAAGGVPRIYVTTIGPAEAKRRAISR